MIAVNWNSSSVFHRESYIYHCLCTHEASRRKPIVVHNFMTQPQVESLFHYYEDALLEIYRFYSASSDNKNRNMVQSIGPAVRTFDDLKNNKEEKDKGKGTQMAYADFLRFAGDFGLNSR